MPKYQEIANILRTRIKNNTYPPDSLLPNQTDLVEEFGVSRMTVKSHRYFSHGRTGLFSAGRWNKNIEPPILKKTPLL